MTAIDRSVRHGLWCSFQIDHAEGARSPRLASAGGGIERRIARPFDSSTGHPADVVRSGETTSSRVRRKRRPVRGIVDRRSSRCPCQRHGREGPVQGKRQCAKGSSCRSVILRSSDVVKTEFYRRALSGATVAASATRNSCGNATAPDASVAAARAAVALEQMAGVRRERDVHVVAFADVRPRFRAQRDDVTRDVEIDDRRVAQVHRRPASPGAGKLDRAGAEADGLRHSPV